MMISWFPVLAGILAAAEDESLVRRLKNRDPEAMAEVYDRYGRITYTLIFRIVRNTAAAEDLVQETFLRVWNRVHGFHQDRGALGPWILAVARNRAIDYLRSLDARMARHATDLDERPELFVHSEQDILSFDHARQLRGAFEKLTPNQKMAIELAYFEGLSQSEIAGRMKQPLGTIKTWVRTALRTLREEFGKAVSA